MVIKTMQSLSVSCARLYVRTLIHWQIVINGSVNICRLFNHVSTASLQQPKYLLVIAWRM